VGVSNNNEINYVRYQPAISFPETNAKQHNSGMKATAPHIPVP